MVRIFIQVSWLLCLSLTLASCEGMFSGAGGTFGGGTTSGKKGGGNDSGNAQGDLKGGERGDDGTPSTERNKIFENPKPNGTLADQPGYVALCSDAAKVQTKAFPIHFDSNWNGQTCPTGGDNLAKDTPVKHALTSRREEAKTFSIPANSILCSLALKATNDHYYYDDVLLMNFEKVYLFGRYMLTFWQSKGAVAVGDSVQYDWTKLRGAYDQPMGPQCPVGGTCKVPITPEWNETGDYVLQVDVPPAWFSKLPVATLKKTTFELQHIIGGNQNANTDCTHSELDLEATVKFRAF